MGLTRRKDNKPTDEMPFWEHADVLRNTVFHMLIGIGAAFVLWFFVLPYIFDSVILGPTSSFFFLWRWFNTIAASVIPAFEATAFSTRIININIASQFMTHMEVALYLAVITTIPYLAYALWKFIRPALHPEEEKSISTAFLSRGALFYAGILVGYALIFPITFRFLIEYTLSTGVSNQFNLNSYVSMFLSMITIMGISFEFPILAWTLSSLGLIDKPLLRKYRKHAVVTIMIVVAIMTPTGDPFTMLITAFPLYLLYELSIRLVKEHHG